MQNMTTPSVDQAIAPAQPAAHSTSHPDASKPIVALKCACCGARFRGRQFNNQDTGWGLGNCCNTHGSRTDDLARTYGIDGVHYNLPQLDQPRSFDGDRLFIGVYPTGIIYADKAQDVCGDFARLAYLNFDSLTLKVEPDCPADLRQRIEADAVSIQAKRGEQFRVSTAGQSVLLGSVGTNHG